MKKNFIKQKITLIFVFSLITLFSCSSNSAKIVSISTGIETNRDSILAKMQSILDSEFKLWYPLVLDTVYGGYFSDINYKWELEGAQNKFIVTQSRHIWSTSNAAIFYKDKPILVKFASHGYNFLKNVMWDKEFGGFYDMVNRQGEPYIENGQIVKRAYGNAFAIYGLAAFYKASGEERALELAKEAFKWLEKFSYDSIYGGYFQFITREGKPFTNGYMNQPPKDQNSSIHILECYTELYKVWNDEKLKERLLSLLNIIRDTITTDKGYMTLFFRQDWMPVSFRESKLDEIKENYELDHVSFGHDVETAYLMLEASEALGIENDTTTLRIAKKMIDHAIKYGLDRKNGGLYDGGYYFKGDNYPKIVKNTKEVWSQAEALNSFLMMSELFPDDILGYYKNFCLMWAYINKYLIDWEHGGWYIGGTDIVSRNKYLPKGTIWKGNYHTSRSLINSLRKLNSRNIVN